eukprot:Clim_evm25s166 gene=Clim_evmTU25s166
MIEENLVVEATETNQPISSTVEQDKGTTSHASQVARHYDRQPGLSRHERAKHPIFHLKNFNNWVKSCLISTYLQPGSTVLDLCCGKGGDLAKWSVGKVSYLVGADISAESIRVCEKRSRESKKPFDFHYVVADLSNENLSAKVDDACGKEIYYDFVSCQFAYHYSFETEEKARMLLHNATERLKPGGYFVGTIPNCYRIVKSVMEADGLSFGNDIYQVTFEDKKNFPKFGAKYKFWLKGTIDNMSEFLVHWETFISVAAEFDLELVEYCRFHEYFDKKLHDPDDNKRREAENLLKRMTVLNPQGEIPANQWEAIGLYVLFAFKKKTKESD